MSEQRLDRLFHALNARERGKLVLKAIKVDTEEEPLIRITMPPEQVEEFNRYMGLIRGVNVRLASMIVVLRQEVVTTSQRIGWLATLALFDSISNYVQTFLLVRVKEPITESEYEARRREAAVEVIPIDELAELEAGAFEDWLPEDLERTEDGSDLLSAAAWERVKEERAGQLRRLVNEGILAGKRTRRGLSVRADSYYIWKGEAVPVFPDLGSSYEVVPDAEAAQVQRWRLDREMVTKALSRFYPADEGADDNDLSGLAQILAGRITEDSQHSWRYLEACRRVIEEVALEFDGEDPCESDLRGHLDEAITEIQGLASKGCPGGVEPFELPEPSEDDMEKIRRLALGDD